MKKLLTAFAAALAAAFPLTPAGVAPAFAQQQAAACTAIAGDTERLACYDAIFLASGGPSAETIILESQQLIPARPTGRERAVIELSCGPDGLAASFEFANQVLVATNSETALSYQIDFAGTVVRNLPTSNEGTRVGFATPEQTMDFFDAVLGGRTLRIRVTPPRQRSLTVDFRLIDRRDEIAALRQSCG